ncbi:hypothetical protein TW95_gp0183 [Pandoravirus inopinatum]|uniref:Uncharacterized protein n=1 Tax=Pandoravirus inopinatum TaxID=1605721 RepID=A0A0B5JBH7_9VIRU|nr:hypothetical protein TW95_gp0183 [Pandoravirus inopinatum]AJF96917.1 hypothetical protein [Pandoravirus inopinatum]
MDDDYAQPEDLMPPSAALLDQVRDELGPWRNHSAVHAVIVDGTRALCASPLRYFPPSPPSATCPRPCGSAPCVVAAWPSTTARRPTTPSGLFSPDFSFFLYVVFPTYLLVAQ